jgi:hypothetical protein
MQRATAPKLPGTGFEKSALASAPGRDAEALDGSAIRHAGEEGIQTWDLKS